MSKKMDKIKGGNADGMTPEEVARKHKVSVKDIDIQIKKGINIEMEHVDDEDLAKEIALDHLFEIPDYYTRLDKMEKKAKKDMKKGKENITGFEIRMRELAGISEGLDKKYLKTIDKGESKKLSENFDDYELEDRKMQYGINPEINIEEMGIGEIIFNSYINKDGDKIYDLSNAFKIGPTSIGHFVELAKEDDEIYSFLNSELGSNEGVDTGNDIFWGADIFDFLRKNKINENFMSDEMFEKMRTKAINYLNDTSGWITVLYEPNNNSLVLFTDVNGLDPVRDEVDSDEIDNYMELSVEEVAELIKSGKVTPYIKENVPNLGESKNKKSEFETYKFKQKSVDEGDEDSEIYNLNENTIIILDFPYDSE